MEAPEVRYARSGDVNIAYGVVGNGPIDLVFIAGHVVSTLELAWQGRRPSSSRASPPSRV